MKCLIIAAGEGSRLQQKGQLKPLVQVRGASLIEHVMRNAFIGGVTEFYIVSGYRGEQLRPCLDQLGSRFGWKINHIVNRDWKQANGLSVLKAKGILNEHFLLLMSDHLIDPSIIADLSKQTVGDQQVMLAVDRNITNPLIDLEDVTRVQQEAGKIRNIGKGIDNYNVFDTGIFHCSPALFKAIELSQIRSGDLSLSGGMQVLAAQANALSYEIDGRFWLDVDDPIAFEKAENYLASLEETQELKPASVA